MILTGEHKGQLGRLIQRDKKKNSVTVQLLDQVELHTCTQDDIAEYAP